jgi:hypothetical protein
MFASIQASSGAQVALTHAAYNHLKKVCVYLYIYNIMYICVCVGR